MKLFLLLCVLVQTNAFRVPLPYGTGVASSGQGKGHQGIWTWFADDNSLQQVQEDTISGEVFRDGFDQFVQEIQQVLKDSLLKVKHRVDHDHLTPTNSERYDFERHPNPSSVRM